MLNLEKYLSHYKSENILTSINLTEKNNTKYVLKTLGCAIYTYKTIEKKNFSEINFNDELFNIYYMGGDKIMNTTISSIILGAKLGYKNLPADKISNVINKKYIDSILVNLFNKLIDINKL